MKTFEQYLETLHAKNYHGVDDDMPEDYFNWLQQFDVNDILEIVKIWEKNLGFWEQPK